MNELNSKEELIAALNDARERIKELTDALNGVMPYVITQVIACNGWKCRLSVCESCSFEAEEAAEKAEIAYKTAQQLLGE